jgi:hypothetical protein
MLAICDSEEAASGYESSQDTAQSLHLLQELQMKRTWEPKEHPQWLAFEVEGRLKIRPAQHRVAQYLMDNPVGRCKMKRQTRVM